MTSWYWKLQLDASVFEKAGELLLVPKALPRSKRSLSQAVQLIPRVQAAVRFYRKLEQAIQRFAPVWSRWERLSRTLAPCSSIALPSPSS